MCQLAQFCISISHAEIILEVLFKSIRVKVSVFHDQESLLRYRIRGNALHYAAGKGTYVWALSYGVFKKFISSTFRCSL